MKYFRKSDRKGSFFKSVIAGKIYVGTADGLIDIFDCESDFEEKYEPFGELRSPNDYLNEGNKPQSVDGELSIDVYEIDGQTVVAPDKRSEPSTEYVGETEQNVQRMLDLVNNTGDLLKKYGVT